MPRTICLIAALILCPVSVQATWSLGVIDPRTKTIAVAGASCTNSVYGIAGVVPGAGFVFAQAASNMSAKAEALAAIRRNESAAAILKSIANPDFDSSWEQQQYAIVTLSDLKTPATFTGNDTPEARGVRAWNGISVQGNTLVSNEVLDVTFDALRRASWTDDAGLARAIVDALAAGSKAGGDRRCGEATASSAFVTVVRANDRQEAPYVNVVVRRSEANGRNAVTVLQERFNAAIR